MSVTENEFSLTRAASKPSARQNSKFLSVQFSKHLRAASARRALPPAPDAPLSPSSLAGAPGLGRAMAAASKSFTAINRLTLDATRTVACALLLSALGLLSTVHAQDFTYVTNDGAITITKYIGSGRQVTIPDTLNDLPVTSIGSNAFANCQQLINITLPGSLTNIGPGAFSLCMALTSVSIPDGVVSVGDEAFSYCYDLTNVTVGKGVISLGNYPFFYSSSLATIAVDDLNPVYSSAAGVLFDKGQVTLLQCPEGKTGSYSVPETVRAIGVNAFLLCNGLTDITIGNGVTNIEAEAFYSCGNLTNVRIPASVTSIGGQAFSCCYSLQNVVIPDSVTFLGGAVFQDCGALTNAVIGDGVPGIGDVSFSGCSSLGSVTIGTNVTTIGLEAFEFCSSLSNVTIPDSVTNIAYGAFYRCSNLARVTLGSGVTSIATAAFMYCGSIADGVYFRGNAPTTSAYAFLYDFGPTIYYLPGTQGWHSWPRPVSTAPTALWRPRMQAAGTDAGPTNNTFGFEITWTSGMTVVVDVCADLANPNWLPLATNTLPADSCYFSDAAWLNHSARFYRLRWP